MLFALLLAPLAAPAALAATTATVQDFDYGMINSAPSPSLTAPPTDVNAQTVPYDSAAVASEGSAAVTTDQAPVSVVTSLATASIPPSLVVALSATSTTTVPTPVAKRAAQALPRFRKRNFNSTVVDSSTIPDHSTVIEERHFNSTGLDNSTVDDRDTSLGKRHFNSTVLDNSTVQDRDSPYEKRHFNSTVLDNSTIEDRDMSFGKRHLNSTVLDNSTIEDRDMSFGKRHLNSTVLDNSTVAEDAAKLEKRFMEEAPEAVPLDLAKRGDCAKQPDGWALPLPATDDVETFMALPFYHLTSLNAVTPPGYQQTFSNKNASVSANSYLGLQTLRSYDTLGCSKWCDNTTLCTGFNIFYERDPILDPGPNCVNPSTIVNYKCTLWGSGVEPAAANNFGQWREQYQVVISGSNGYEKTNTTQPPTPKGCLKPQRCLGGALRAVGALLDTKFFPGAFDINVCAAYANAQNAYNKRSVRNWFLATNKCKMFNAYMIKRDGVAMGTYCGLYSQYFAPGAATYQPGRLGNNYWGVESSFTAIVESGWIF